MYYLKHLNNNINGIGLESDPAENKFTRQLGLNVVSKFIDTEHEDTEITQLLEGTDIVSFFNVLEHIERPRKYIKYLSDSMKSGSFMVIEVPKHPSLASFANLTSCDNIYQIMGIQNELQMAVDRAGFSDQILIIAKKK